MAIDGYSSDLKLGKSPSQTLIRTNVDLKNEVQKNGLCLLALSIMELGYKNTFTHKEKFTLETLW